MPYSLPQANINPLEFANRPLGFYEVAGLYIVPTYWMVVAIILLIFMLLFTIARVRYLYVHWSLGKSSIAFLFWGFMLAIVVEGFLLLAGRTLFTEIIGWQNAPKPISTALDVGRSKILTVLGEQDQIPYATASEKKFTAEEAIYIYQSLSPEEREKFSSSVCSP